MCGILGLVGANTDTNRKLVQALMLELSLRGTHATGLAWDNDGFIKRYSEALPADAFFKKNPVDYLLAPKFNGTKLRVIGHTRYSTSDLKWNQPVKNHDRALVMNGVISQEPPDKWPTSNVNGWYTEYKTGNDAEIALNFSCSGKRASMPGSWAILELGKTLFVGYRNTHRPLWIGRTDDAIVYASTYDALHRCGVHVVKLCKPGVIYNLDADRADYTTATKQEDIQNDFGKGWFENLTCSI